MRVENTTKSKLGGLEILTILAGNDPLLSNPRQGYNRKENINIRIKPFTRIVSDQHLPHLL